MLQSLHCRARLTRAQRPAPLAMPGKNAGHVDGACVKRSSALVPGLSRDFVSVRHVRGAFQSSNSTYHFAHTLTRPILRVG